MNKFGKLILHILSAIVIFVVANAVALYYIIGNLYFLPAIVVLYLVIQILPSVFLLDVKTVRLRQCAYGCELLRLFLLSVTATVFFVLAEILKIGGMEKLPSSVWFWVGNIGVIVLVEAVTFWNGIIRVYLTSAQLGIKWRVIGILCGWIPVVHLIMLGKIILIADAEVRVEQEKLVLDAARKKEQICQTKYPILLVHGVFFRDWKYLNYWGRIPEELEKNGAQIFYGNHQSALSVSESGEELAGRIKEVLQATGAEKVNIIAHSKGGLDSRYAIAKCGMAPFVASLTTINTPHRGCEFADYLLSKIPKEQQEAVADAYNGALKKLGDDNPDFLAAVGDLTAESCRRRNEEITDSPDVFYQSVGSKLNRATDGRFPLNLSYCLVNLFDGANDGLVGENSFSWGQEYEFLTVEGKRGISHGDMIDLNRENFKGFDVREFYVQLVKKLKEKGF